MTTRVKVEIGAAILGLILLFVAGAAYVAERVDGATMKGKNEGLQVAIDQLKQSDQRRDAEFAQMKSDLAHKFDQVKTPEQIVRVVPQYIPMPDPIQLQKPKDAQGREIPDAPSEAVLTPRNLTALRDYTNKCEQCQLDKQKLQAELDDQVKTTKLVTQQKDNAVAAAKGGTFFQRTKRNAKWLGIGAGVGAVAVTILTHRGK
jgi:chaperonin cofactor prefoldin